LITLAFYAMSNKVAYPDRLANVGLQCSNALMNRNTLKSFLFARPVPRWHVLSLKARIVVATLAIFLLGIFSMAFYASSVLRKDMQQLLSEQQFSAASFMAASINGELENRVSALELTAATITARDLANPATLQKILTEKTFLKTLFNAGWHVVGKDGIALADVSEAQRTGKSFADNDAIQLVLAGSKKTVIGRPLMGPLLKQPVFPIVTAIVDENRQVIGALIGTTNLGAPSFLNKITDHHYGAGRSYVVLVAPQHRLIVTSSDRRRIMEPLLAPGVNPGIDRFVAGYEGTGIIVNPSGVEVLAAAKGVPVAAWYVAILMPTAEVFAPIRAMQHQILLAILVLSLLTWALLWWVLQSQLAPLQVAVKKLALMSSPGQAFEPLPSTHQDEIGQLIAGFNHLLAVLNQQKEALLQSESRLKFDYATSQRVLDALPVGIWIGDCQGNLKQNNPAGRAIWGGERWVGIDGYNQYKGWWSDTGEPLAPQDWGMARAISTGETSVDEMIDIECFDGTRKTILNSAQIIYDADGQPTCALVVNQDITQIKAVQDELNQTRRQLEGLAAQLLTVQEDERHALSRELHDEIGQSLTALKITLDTARRDNPPAKIETALVFAMKVADTLLDTVREIARGLRPLQIDELGLLPALRWHIDNIAQTASLPIDFEWNIGQWRFSPALELCCFRVAQEAITNAVRHAGATAIKVNLMLHNNHLHISVRDNGVGFDINGLYRPSAKRLPLGLLGMRERIAGLRGELHIDSAPGAGTEIRAIFPQEGIL
jgi:signal transduction histidine kinase